ncbi:MAG: GtrA family protein [Zoogloeaceae bacterium]|nr:GtrA family protein [Zoogloeaceae bacterium]
MNAPRAKELGPTQHSFGRFLRFAALGLAGTGAHYLALIGLVEGAGVDPLFASIAGFCLGALVNYLMSHRFVFRSQRAHQEALPRFFAVALTGLAWNALLMKLMVHSAGWPYLVAQLLTTGLLVFWHYAVNAVWTFRTHRD